MERKNCDDEQRDRQNKPELAAQAIEIIPEMIYGGHVRASVTFRLNPNVSTIVGKKFL